MIGYAWLRLVGDCVFGEWFAYYWWHSVAGCLDVVHEICPEHAYAYQCCIMENLEKFGESSIKYTGL